jgi:hypothetical protein
VAKPPTHRGLLTPVSGSLTRITYDQVVPRFMTPSWSRGVVLRLIAHKAAVLLASSLETYSSRAVSGMRRDPLMRIETMAPLAISS